MTVYYSKASGTQADAGTGTGTLGDPLNFATVTNWHSHTDGSSGADASSLAGHDLVIQSGHYMKLVSNVTTDSLDILSGGHMAASGSHVLTLAGADGGNDVILITGTLDDQLLNITITRSGTGNVKLDGAGANNMKSLTINHAGCNVSLTEAATIAGHLTVTAGTINTANFNFTVSADVEVTGTLKTGTSTFVGGNSYIRNGGEIDAHDNNSAGVGTCSFYSFTIDAGGEYKAPISDTIIREESGGNTLENSGVFTSNGGTLVLACATDTNLDATGSGGYGVDRLHNVVINPSDGTNVTTMTSGFSITGDLTILDAAATLVVNGNDFAVQGTVTNNGVFTAGSQALFAGGFRQRNAFTGTGLLTINGTGGVLEGNFDDCPITVSLDPYINFGSRGYLRDAVADFQGSITSGMVSFWAKLPSYEAGGTVFSVSDEATENYYSKVKVDSAGRYSWNHLDGAGNSYVCQINASLSDDSWHHITFDCNGTNFRAFVDGRCAAITETTAGSGVTAATAWFGDNSGATDNVMIGAAQDSEGVGGHFPGPITDVRVYNASKSTTGSVGAMCPNIAQIAAKMNGEHPLAIRSDQLPHWWKLNEGHIQGGTDYEDYGSGTDFDMASTGIGNENIIYDEFYCDLQSSGTGASAIGPTTDGEFTVASGRVEGLGLSTYDGERDTNQLIKFDEINIGSVQTLSCWVKHESLTGTQTYFGGNSAGDIGMTISDTGDDFNYQPKTTGGMSQVSIDVSDTLGAALALN